ncbi:MAG: hypothetical protein HY549_04520 [Elusimicrobia bacterium]|nr:hypothetical protein [Elusimicrobiota bacterium]
MTDKVSILMEETGCDQGEAELALEMCGYELEKAVRTISRLLRNIVAIKGRFVDTENHQVGLILLVADTKSSALLRCRSVLSFNPAVHQAPLDKDWFDFEKFLYGCRLLDGSLPNESLEIERRLSGHFQQAAALSQAYQAPVEELASQIEPLLRGALRSTGVLLQLQRDILDLGQFKSLRSDPDGFSSRRAAAGRSSTRPEDLLVLKVSLEQSGDGPTAKELRAGQVVSAWITDPRDIAQYLSRLFGGHSAQGPVGIPAPVEAVESHTDGQCLARVRFSAGVCGDALVHESTRLKLVRELPQDKEGSSWWHRFFRGGNGG